MPNRIAFLKKGTFKDSNGKEHTFSDADLDTIVAKYDPSQHEAPEVIGHPKTDAPAWGWVKGVKREGDLLFYEPGQRVSEFQQMIDNGMFKKRSAALYPDLTLKHIGWLGAQPPAVKGLPDPVTFAEGEEIVIEFSEFAEDPGMIGKMKTMLGEMLDMVSGKKKKPEDPPKAGGVEMSKKEEDMGKIEELEQQLADEKRKVAEFAESEKANKDRLLKIEADNRRKDFAAFCEGLTKEGKLPPAVVPQVLDFMECFSGIETFEFAEGEGKKAAAPVEMFKAFLGGLGTVIEFSEQATKDKVDARKEADDDNPVVAEAKRRAEAQKK